MRIPVDTSRHLCRLTLALVAATACHPSHGTHGQVTSGALRISDAYLVTPAGDAPAAMYFTVKNVGAVPDTLSGIAVDGVTKAELHTEVMSPMPHPTGPQASESATPMNMATMVATPFVPLSPYSTLRFAPGGRHVMLMGIQRHFARGDSTSADLSFAHAGMVNVPVQVIDYSQLDTLVHP